MGSETINNIVYLDYRTTATASTQYENSVKPESLANIIKNNILIYNDTIIIEENNSK